MNDLNVGGGLGGSGERMLAALGVSAVEECVYRALLEQPETCPDALDRKLGLTPGLATQALARLSEKGLVACLNGRPASGYIPAPPDVAVEALVAKKQQELHRARLAARELQLRTRAASTDQQADQMVELITGHDAVVLRITHLLATAQHEVMSFDLPAYVSGRDIGELNALRRGVRYRIVCGRPALDCPGMLDQIRQHATAGAEARVSKIPIKLLIIDSEAAVLPLYSDTGLTASVLVRTSPLLDALVTFFEHLWERAVPLGLTNGMPQPESSAANGTDATALVTYLTAGLKDESIARRLGVSSRTFDRRMQTLMRKLDATTRFQAGWNAALRYLNLQPQQEPGIDPDNAVAQKAS